MNKLITPELEKSFLNYPLYSQDNKRKNAICVCIFCIGSIRWYVLEGQREGDDFTLFSIVVGLSETEYGYVSVNELENIQIDARRYGLGIMKVTQVPAIKECPLVDIPDDELQTFLVDMYGEKS